MNGDITRSTFKREKHYSGVRMQQGRVQLDADWNEYVDIVDYLAQRSRYDAFGVNGAPAADAGFAIEATPDGSDLIIAPGRMYVEGVLCELEDMVFTNLSFSGDDMVQLDVWPADLALEPGQWVELHAAQGSSKRLKILEVDQGQRMLKLSGATTEFQHTQVELHRLTTYTTQADLPGATVPLPLFGPVDGVYLIYLDVWQRHISAVEDPDIREPALGGPDTATRTRTICQVKWLQVGAKGARFGRDSHSDAWERLIAPSSGTLRARAASAGADAPASASYLRPENRLYRVEIHEGGTAVTSASFKWSRDNGSIVADWAGQEGATLIVGDTRPHEAQRFASGLLVELSGDTWELQGVQGTLARLGRVDGQRLTIDTAYGLIDRDRVGKHPLIRRWDASAAEPIATKNGGNDWIALGEDGIEVQFDGGSYRSGDYWLIPSRPVMGDVEWPRDVQGEPLPLMPHGIAHHYCRLAVAEFKDKKWAVGEDCRALFPSLVDLFDEPSMHVKNVQLKNTGGKPLPLNHDAQAALDTFISGLQIEFDANVDPEAIQRASCYVSLEMPLAASSLGSPVWGSPAFGYQTLILAGDTKADPSNPKMMTWEVAEAAKGWLQSKVAELIGQLGPQERGLLARLTLKGNHIWSADDPSMYLDGEVFGMPSAQPLRQPSITMSLPVGQAGLSATPGIAASNLTAAGSVSGQSGPLASAGLLAGAARSLARTPPGLSRLRGLFNTNPQRYRNLRLPSGDGRGGGDFELWFWLAKGAAHITLANFELALGSGIAAVLAGSNITGMITLTGEAPAGGLPVTLSYTTKNVLDNPPDKIIIAAGQSSAPFTIVTRENNQSADLVITATGGDISRKLSVTIVPTPIRLSFEITPSTVQAGQQAMGMLSLNRAADRELIVELSVKQRIHGQPHVQIPATVPIKALTTGSRFSIGIPNVAAPQDETITARLGNVMLSARLKIHPLAPGHG